MLGWLIIVAILLFLGYATKFHDQFSKQVLLTWFIVTPLILIASHIPARSIITSLYTKGHSRPTIVIGANETSLQFIQLTEAIPFLLITFHGFYYER